MATKRRGKLVPKTKIASNWLSEEETPKARKKDTYKCFCNKRYSSAAYLARHILKHHAPTNGTSTEDVSALQEGNRQETSSNTEIPGPVPSSDASTKNTSQDAGTRVEEGTSSVPSPGIIGKSRSTKAPKKKLKTKGRAKPASSYKYRNRQQKTQAKPAARLPSQSDTITPKIEIDVDNLDLGDTELVQLGEDGTRDLDTTVDSFPQSVYDFNDASDDEGVADLPDFKGEDFEDDLSDKEDSKENILDESTAMSLGATSTSGIGTQGSTPGKKRVTKTYQGGMMKRLHACHICTKTYSSVGKLKRHMKSHTEEGQKRLFTCGICQKSFNSNSVLIAHIRVHTGEKPFKCDECKMAFKQTSHLNRHKRVHSGEKPFTCEICNKGFPHNFNLVIHRRKHTGEKPYVCNVCNHPFADRSNLNKHMPRCLKRLCEQIDVIGSLDDSSDEFGSERRKKNAINKIKSEFTQGDIIDDNLFEDHDMHFPVTYEQVITQAVEEAPGTSAYMDEASFQTAEEGSSYGLGEMEGHSMGPSLIGQIEPSRMMREVDVTFVEEESIEGDFAKKFRKKDPNKKGDFTLADTSTPKKRPRPKQAVGFPAPKRQATPKRRSPKKPLTTSDKEMLEQHSILPHNIFQDSNEGVGTSHLSHSVQTGGRRDESPGRTGSDFAMLAEQILEDHLPMESESNLTAELLIPVDSGWIEQSKNRGKEMMQHDQITHRRPPPVSELFKLTRPPEMDDNLSGPISPSYPPVSVHSLTWSTQMSAPPSMPLPASTSSAQMSNSVTECVVLPSVQDKPTEYTTMEIDQPFHSSPSLLSPTHARPCLSPSTLGAEVEEVYAHYPDTNYDQGLEVDTKNIIISEPDRNY